MNYVQVGSVNSLNIITAMSRLLLCSFAHHSITGSMSNSSGHMVMVMEYTDATLVHIEWQMFKIDYKVTFVASLNGMGVVLGCETLPLYEHVVASCNQHVLFKIFHDDCTGRY